VVEQKGLTVPNAEPAKTEINANLKAGRNAERKSEPNDVGTALRNAFRATVEEDIPSEMLDLLRRLD
jgi:Anti-sigma factor NepR